MKRFLSASPTPSLIEDASPKGAGKSLAASALIHVGILAGIAAILTVSPLQKTESAGNQALQIDLGPAAGLRTSRTTSRKAWRPERMTGSQ